MKMLKQTTWVIFWIILVKPLTAQDPSFSQFFSSPLNINPALTANINADWRAIFNFRDQWVGPAFPFVTGTLSYDSKIFQHKIPNVHEEKNIWGIGGMLMYDHAMDGIVRSTYASLNGSYNIKLAGDVNIHRLGIGFGGIYGRRQIDFSRIDFEEQFTGYGFNTSLPTGEVALSNMKGYLSMSVGLTYSLSSEKSNFDFGVAAFHVNKPKQTFLEDKNQVLAMRKVVHGNFETFLTESLILNVNAIYQYQSKAHYFSAGGAIGYYIPSNQDLIVNGGFWYWSKNAVIPYVGFGYQNYQFGFSYDLTISKLRQASDRPNTWELSFIIRGEKDPVNVIPCPWK